MRWLMLASVLAGGCVASFDPASYVLGLRVLGIRADPPEIAAGETTTVSAIVDDNEAYDGGSSPGSLQYLWTACTLTPLAGSSSLNEGCFNQSGDGIIPLGVTPTITVTMPSVPLEQLGLPDATDGFYLPIILYLSNGSSQLTAVYHLRDHLVLPMGFDQPRNQNPTIDQILIVPSGQAADAGDSGDAPLLASAPPTLRMSDTINLKTTFLAGSDESYFVLDPDALTELIDALSVDGGIRRLSSADGGIGALMPTQETELLTVSWFATAGSFSNDKTGIDEPVTTFRLDKNVPAPGSTIDLYVVARDERGGLDSAHRTFIVGQ